MNRISRLAALFAAAAMLAAVPAKADGVKFFTGTLADPINSPTFTDGPGSLFQLIVGLAQICSGGNCSGADVRATNVAFNGGISASSNGPAGTGVWWDRQPNFAGLGVGPLNGIPDSADQIQPGDSLTIKFDRDVRLTGVSTLFDAGHTPFGSGFDVNTNVIGSNTFSLNGMTTTFLAANLMQLGVVGHEFTFAAKYGQPQFYLSGLQFSEVPLPGAIWLFGAGLLGMIGLGRKQKMLTGRA